jgi:hypothetical protein
MGKVDEMYDAFQITEEDKTSFQKYSDAFSAKSNDVKAYTIKTVVIDESGETIKTGEAPHA